MTTAPEPLINSTAVFVIHLVIVVTNVLSMVFSISWVCFVCLRLKNIRKQAGRVEVFDSVELKDLRNKRNKYYLFLIVMIIEAIHVGLRLWVYIAFTVFDKFPYKLNCTIIEDYKAYQFIVSLQPCQFTWIGLSHSFALALVISMNITVQFIRESYSYYEKSFRWIKIWIVFGSVQFLSVWIFLSIPYIALIGSALFIVFAFVDYVALFRAAKRLLTILNMRLFDLKYEPLEYTRFRRSMLKLQWLGFFLLSLFIYMFGIVLAHVAIWTSLLPCFLDKYYSINWPVFNATQVETVANVGSIVWLLDYIAIFQFDVVLVSVNLFYLLYTRVTRTNIREETRHLMEQYNDSITRGPRTYSL